MSPKRRRKCCPIWLEKFSELALRAERTEQSGVSEVLTTVMRPTPTKWGEGKFFCMQGHSSLLEKKKKKESYNKKMPLTIAKKFRITSADKESFLSSKIRASTAVRGARIFRVDKKFGRGNTKYCRTLYPLFCDRTK